MKLLIIFLLMFTVLMVLTIAMNFFIYSLDIKQAFLHWANPLLLMKSAEKMIYILYPMAIVLLPIIHYIKKKRQGKKA